MRNKVTLLCIGIISSLIGTGTAFAQPGYKYDKSNRVVELTKLAGDEDDGCMSGGPQLSGRVVRRAFDKSGIVIESVTIEGRTGERTLINVATSVIDELDQVTRSIVLMGLQTLLREGSRVSVGVTQCGAAGRVLMLDTVRPVGR